MIGLPRGWPVNPTSASAGSGHAKLARLLVGPGKRARLSARVRGLLVRRGGVCRREEPPRDESGLRAHGSNQRFHRLLGHAVARVRTTAPSLAGLGPAARRILIHHGWRRKGPPGTLSHKPLRNPEHHLVGGITDVRQAEVGRQLGQRRRIRPSPAFSSHRHCGSDFRAALCDSVPGPARRPTLEG